MDSIYQETKSHADTLLEILKKRLAMSEKEAESVVHALVDIAESIEKVYRQIIPGIVKDSNADLDALKERVWDIREEFRHITYHISDGNLTEL